LKIATYKKTKEIIDKYDFVFKKSFGQNFLIDQHVMNKIIAGSNVTRDDIVIEIGPGIGALTEFLCENALKVIAVEIDRNLIPILNETLKDYDNLEIINGDILQLDIEEILKPYEGKNVYVVANLPYNIATPVVMGFLEKKHKIKALTVMVQKEVAERMGAKPSSKSYGSLSLTVQYFSEPEIVAIVPQNCFVPRPKIDSAVIRLDILDKPRVDVSNEELFFRIIKYSFGQRRKTFVNTIFNQSNFNLSKEEIINLLENLGYDKNVRGETFTLEDFSRITTEFENLLKRNKTK